MLMPKNLIEHIENNKLSLAFASLYGTDELILNQQKQRYIRTINNFIKFYGDETPVELYSAPGRSEICGNHTDHNNGVVFAAAINLDIIAVVAKTSNNIVHLRSEGFSKEDVINLSTLDIQENEKEKSASLIRGVAAAITNKGGNVGGLNVFTTSNVLRGSGLSSSAAFEVCLANIFNSEFNNGVFSAIELAIMCQFAENEYFGKPSGLMDQMACSVGGGIAIDFKNTENPIVNETSLNLQKHGHKLIITDTKGSHANLTSEYGYITSEMKSVANVFGKNLLREVSFDDFSANIAKVRETTSDRAVLRAIHFFTECERVRLLEKSLLQDDFNMFLQIIKESGHSSFEFNQNAYSASTPQNQGVSLGLALSQMVLGTQGAFRLHGGGFAGTIQAFVPNQLEEAYCKTLENVFGENACYVLNVRNIGGTKVKLNS